MPSSDRPAKPVIFAITATGIMVNTLVNASLPEIVEGLGASQASTGLLLGAATMPGILLAPVLGLLADRYGRRRVLVPCLVLFGLAGLGGTVAPTLGWMLVVRLLQGVGSAGLINLAIVLIGDHYPEDRSTVIGQNSAVLTTCLALYPPVGGFLTDLFGFRAPFVLYALAGLTAVLVARSVDDDRTPDGAFGPAVRQQVRRAWPTIRTRPVPGLFGAGFLSFALIFGLLLTVLPIYLADAFGLSASERGLVLTGIAVCNGLTAINLGRIARAVDQRRRVLVGLGSFAVGAAVIALAPTPWWMLPALVLVGVGDGLTLPTLQDGAAAAGDDDDRGTVVAAFVSVARTGQTVGPVAASGALAVMGAPAVLGVGALLAAVSLPLISRTTTPAYQPTPAGRRAG